MYNCKLYDKGDWILRASLYTVGRLLRELPITEEIVTVKKHCRLFRWFGHRKSPEYKWSNSGSENIKENTLFKRPTYWIYNNILRHFGIDLYKGANGDQFRAYFLYLYLRKDWQSALRILCGFDCRLTLFPSLMESWIFKPQTLVLLFKIPFPFKLHWLWRPFYWISYIFFRITSWYEIEYVPIRKSTNKISMLPTRKVLGLKMPPDKYIEKVYNTYFCSDEEGGVMIRESLIKALTEIE